MSRAVTTNGRGSHRFPRLMSTERDEALGLDVVETAVLLINPTDLTDTQRRELGYLTSGDDERIGFVEPGDPQPTPTASSIPRCQASPFRSPTTPSNCRSH
jgi:hypothetical protein